MVTTSYKGSIRKNFFENLVWKEGALICGIDEVGRGCFAGPVVAGAVILYPHKKSILIKDSKLLTQQGLLEAYDWIIQNSWHSFALVSPRDIDRYNIYHATLRAMKRAFMQLMLSLDQESRLLSHVVIDAMPLDLASTDFNHVEVSCFPFGENSSISIAAASVFAKVTRDRLMQGLNSVFSGYGFEKHKGYGTKAHQAALIKKGRCLIHRMSFVKRKYDERYSQVESDEKYQQSFCRDY